MVAAAGSRLLDELAVGKEPSFQDGGLVDWGACACHPASVKQKLTLSEQMTWY